MEDTMKRIICVIGVFSIILLGVLSRQHTYAFNEVDAASNNALSYGESIGISDGLLPYQQEIIYENRLIYLAHSRITPYNPISNIDHRFLRDWSVHFLIDQSRKPNTLIDAYLFIDESDEYHVMVVYEKPFSKTVYDYLYFQFDAQYEKTILSHQALIISNDLQYDARLQYKEVQLFDETIQLPQFNNDAYFNNDYILGGFHIHFNTLRDNSDFFSLDITIFQDNKESSIPSVTLGINEFHARETQTHYYVQRHHILFQKDVN